MALPGRSRARAKAKARRTHPSQGMRVTRTKVGSEKAIRNLSVRPVRASVAKPVPVAKPVSRARTRARKAASAAGKVSASPLGQMAMAYGANELVKRSRKRQGGASQSQTTNVNIGIQTLGPGGRRGRGRRYKRDRRGRFS